MKKILLIVLIGLSACAMGQQTYFLSGGIVYGITSDAEQTVEVLPYSYLLSSPYSGAVTIPQTVDNNGTTFTVTALGESAFENCTNVTGISLPTTIKSIGSYCFYNCRFTSLQLPDSLKCINDHAFMYSSVGTIHLPAHFEAFGDATFWARDLTSIMVDTNNPHFRSIGGWLYSKDSLTLCVVPDGVSGTISVPTFVRHIGNMAFGFNSRATSISLPEDLESIGNFAFNCCSRINNVTIPSTVTRIGICPFSYCPQLTNLTIASGNQHYVMDGLMLYSINYDTLISCHKSGDTVTLRPTVKVLGGFENNTWAKNITVPAGVTDISDNCFNACTFTSIVLPAHMNSIGSYAFGTNSSLISITMPQSLRTMGSRAFCECMKLTSITIPDSLRIIPSEAFNSCIKLRSISWGKNVEAIGYAAFWAISVTDLVLPPTLRKIDDYAFAACNNAIHTVTFTGQVDTIGEGAFRHAALRRLKLVNDVPPVTIGAGCLTEITTLDSIIIPCGSTSNYTSDSYWSQFTGKYYEACDGINVADGICVSVYPNPVTNLLTIEGVKTLRKVELYNATGQLMLSLPVQGTTLTLDVSHLQRGVYILRMTGPQGMAIRNVILN